jgi:hypothetical protein
MTADLHMCWREVADDPDFGGPTYQTLLFGGTVNHWYAEQVADEAERRRRHAFNEAFLQAQLRAVERVMRGSCADLGFPPA